MITGHFVLGYTDQLRGFWEQSRAMRWIAGFLIFFFTLTLLFEIANQLSGSDSSSLEMILIMAAIIAGWPVMIVLGVRRMTPGQRDVTYQIDGERLVMRDAAGNELSSPWSEVTACHEGKAGLVFRIGPTARWFAKRAFAAAALDALRALARDKLGDRARLS